MRADFNRELTSFIVDDGISNFRSVDFDMDIDTFDSHSEVKGKMINKDALTFSRSVNLIKIGGSIRKICRNGIKVNSLVKCLEVYPEVTEFSDECIYGDGKILNIVVARGSAAHRYFSEHKISSELTVIDNFENGGNSEIKRNRAKNIMALEQFEKSLKSNEKYLTGAIDLKAITPYDNFRGIMKLIDKYFKLHENENYLDWFEYNIKPEDVLGGREPYPVSKFIEKLKDTVISRPYLVDGFKDALRGAVHIFYSKYTLYYAMHNFTNELDDVELVADCIQETGNSWNFAGRAEFGNGMFGIMVAESVTTPGSMRCILLVIYEESIIGVYSLFENLGMFHTQAGICSLSGNAGCLLSAAFERLGAEAYNRILNELEVSNIISDDSLILSDMSFPMKRALQHMRQNSFYMKFVATTSDGRFIFQNYYNLKYYIFEGGDKSLRLIEIQDSIGDLMLERVIVKRGRYLRNVAHDINLDNLSKDRVNYSGVAHNKFIKKFADGNEWSDINWDNISLDCLKQLIKFGYLKAVKGRASKCKSTDLEIRLDKFTKPRPYNVEGLELPIRSYGELYVNYKGTLRVLVSALDLRTLLDSLHRLANGERVLFKFNPEHKSTFRSFIDVDSGNYSIYYRQGAYYIKKKRDAYSIGYTYKIGDFNGVLDIFERIDRYNFYDFNFDKRLYAVYLDLMDGAAGQI